MKKELFITLALTSTAFANNYHCEKITTLAAPPPPIKGIHAKHTALKPLCPKGYVPQPIANPVLNEKGLPPHGAAYIPAGYHYVYSYLHQNGKGALALFSQHKPYLHINDAHTLAEIAVESRDAKQIAEIGWTVDRNVNRGDDKPHLFVFHWINGQPTCYNGCGYVQYSRTSYPGMVVPQNGSKNAYQIYYHQGNWWLGYDTEWLGYFPATLWQNKGANFTQTELTQWFGEVSSGGGVRTQMGNGIFGSASGSASFSNIMLLTSLNEDLIGKAPLFLGFGQTDPQCFNYGATTANSYRYGGPGC